MSAEGEARNMEARAGEGCGLTPEELEDFTAKLVAALNSVYDPKYRSISTNWV